MPAAEFHFEGIRLVAMLNIDNSSFFVSEYLSQKSSPSDVVANFHLYFSFDVGHNGQGPSIYSS